MWQDGEYRCIFKVHVLLSLEQGIPYIAPVYYNSITAGKPPRGFCSEMLIKALTDTGKTVVKQVVKQLRGS